MPHLSSVPVYLSVLLLFVQPLLINFQILCSFCLPSCCLFCYSFFIHYSAKSGMTLAEIVAEYNKTHEPTTTQNISNKLTRGTIKYSECLELAKIMGYDISLIKRG